MAITKRTKASKATANRRKQAVNKATPTPRPQSATKPPQAKEPPYDYAATGYHSMARFLRRVYADEILAASVKHIKFCGSLDLLEYSGLLLDDSFRGTPSFKTALAKFNTAVLSKLKSKDNPNGYNSTRDIPLSCVLPLYADLFSICKNIETVTMPRSWMNIFPVFETFAEVERPRNFYAKGGKAWVMFGSLEPCVMCPGKHRDDDSGQVDADK